MMIKECCSTVFGGKGDDQVGYSETILSRHLARAEVGTATATAHHLSAAASLRMLLPQIR
jgi:hypothetical protein